jgi:catechol 2,3-dioxygenase-like lactoylglutathione lyase family enzyme
MDVRGLAPLLQVFDLAESVRFYRDVPGFTAVAWSHTQ